MCKENWLSRYWELSEGKKAIEKEMAELKEKIMAGIPEGEERQQGDFKAKWQTVVSERFDSSAFKADHADLYEEYKKPSESVRLDVKPLPKSVL